MNTRRESPQKMLGSAIRERRLELDVSQEKLAELVGVHRNYVGKVERGEQNLTIESLVRFADTFKCRPSELLGEAGL
ncbi:helix-turn-helix domain-containing protein [Pontiella desulfatans]|uniref:helix-turn-helix domain-containing protein n=1 Tax=Pontiella desulfatans TaxID=2750659 RepID=UPI001C9E377A|nr:helix-turn-helix transcriptional regulator [Pontiella desulfatans]